jgi:hypothetical protein
MLTAPVFAVLAGLVLFVYPESAENRWNPVILSITHLLVLGFSVMVMFGAIQQLLPVLAGVSFRRPVLISISLYGGLCLGVLSLCLGLLMTSSTLLLLAITLMSLTIGVFFVLVISGLLASDVNPRSIQGIRFSLIAFLFSALIGLYLAAGHALASVPLQRSYTDIHLTWGLLGWIGLLIISVSYQVVPMFQITPKYPESVLKLLTPVIFAALLLWSLSEIQLLTELSDLSWPGLAFELILSAGFAVFCICTFYLHYKRRRKLPDVTLDYFRLGLAAFLVAVVVWWIPLESAAAVISTELFFGIVVIVGFSMSIISGMLYKIVPFLIWLHLTNQIQMSTRWERNLPNMKQIIPDIHARWQYRLHALALVLLIMSSSQIEWLVQIAAMALIISNLYLFRNLVAAVLMYRKVVSEAVEKNTVSSQGE